MEKESLDLLRYPRKKIHKHEKTKNMKPLRQMQALCDELDSDNLHVVADSLDSLMFRMSQEQPVMDPGVQNTVDARINEMRNLQIQQESLQQEMQALQGRPEAMQQVKALAEQIATINARIQEINAELENLQRTAG